MAKKKSKNLSEGAELEAEVRPQYITDTIVSNYMPYVMSVIVSRAIPEIDGFKPSHRKLLYTMYKMGLLNGARTKSANVVGQTMKLNPHGDMSIYETLVRLTRGHDALLHPFIDSKGSFGKNYSSSMAFAASRYTEVKLDPICNEIFRGIDKNSVDFVPNYDNTLQEPKLLPVAFPNVLVSANMGIAVGMASKIASFNLAEVCDGTIMLLKRPYMEAEKLLDVIKGPDFSGGAYLIYDREKLKEIYETGKGSVKMRAKYRYDAEYNCIDILEIPYSTTIEVILKKLTELVKNGVIKELSDFRDEIDLSGFKLSLDLKKGVNPDEFMTKLFKLTSLEDNFECNFNILIDSTPKQLGVKGILEEWIKFRVDSIRRETEFDIEKLREKLHLLQGLAKILLDIDLAIKIIRDTKSDKEVVPNLMKGFAIDEKQAEYVADIKLRTLNSEHIINRLDEISEISAQITLLLERISDEKKIKEVMIEQLTEIKKKYAKPRKTEFLMPHEVTEYSEKEIVETLSAKIFATEKGYLKKITLASLRGNDEHLLRDDDKIFLEMDVDNTETLMIFTDRGQLYNSKTADFPLCRASQVGEYIPAFLEFEENEKVSYVVCVGEEKEDANIVLIFENGKGLRVPYSAYSKNRRKLINAVSTQSRLVYAEYESQPFDIMIISENNKALVVNTSDIPLKNTKNSGGNKLMELRAKHYVQRVDRELGEKYSNTKKYKKEIPSAGSLFDFEKKT